MFDKIQMILMIKTSISNNRISRLNKWYQPKNGLFHEAYRHKLKKNKLTPKTLNDAIHSYEACYPEVPIHPPKNAADIKFYSAALMRGWRLFEVQPLLEGMQLCIYLTDFFQILLLILS